MCDGSGSGEEANSNEKVCFLWDNGPSIEALLLGLPHSNLTDAGEIQIRFHTTSLSILSLRNLWLRAY